MSNEITLTEVDESAKLPKSRLITATVTWSSDTDYELLALVVLRDGSLVHVATFEAKGVESLADYNGLVRHHGDRGRGHVAEGGGTASETIEFVPSDDIVAVIPYAYSAMNNGLGSFDQFHVTMTVDDGSGSAVVVEAGPSVEGIDADLVHTCVPAIIYNSPDGVVVKRLVLFSEMASERRPNAVLNADGTVDVLMDQGPKNIYKQDPSTSSDQPAKKWWRRHT